MIATAYIDFDPVVWDEDKDYEYAVVFQYPISAFENSFDTIIVTAPDYEDTAWERFQEKHPFQKNQFGAKILFVQRLGEV
jgi:hypothetical protein